MAKILLNPSSGSLLSSKNVKLDIVDLFSDKELRYKIENATSFNEIKIKDVVSPSFYNIEDKYVYVLEGNSSSCVIDINLSEDKSYSLFSIFVTIEEKQGDNFVAIEILPCIYFLENNIESINGSLSLSPSYAGCKDVCSITVDSTPDSKFIFSINDKRLILLTNSKGEGSLHFRVSDIGSISNNLERYPLYFYEKEDNYTKKKFTGSYLHILPKNLETYANRDLRCDDPDPWVMPEQCREVPGQINLDPIEPYVPPIGISSECNSREFYNPPVCRIFNNSSVIEKSGGVLNSYVGISSTDNDPTQDTYNLTKSFIFNSESSVSSRIIAKDDVSVEPKLENEDIRIRVSYDLWNAVNIKFEEQGGNPLVDPSSVGGVYMTLLDSIIGYQAIQIVNLEIDEYTGDYIIVGLGQSAPSEIMDWIFCVPAIFIIQIENPMDIDSSGYANAIYDNSSDKYYPIISTSIASNIYDNSDPDRVYYHVVAEAFKNNSSHLFYQNSSNGSWVQLTKEGNNFSPKIKVDRDNRLSIVWESDRTGNKQIYYSVLGQYRVASSIASISSIVDKFSEFKNSDKESLTYISDDIILDVRDQSEYNFIPEYNTEDLVDGNWDIYESNGGNVSETSNPSYFLNDLDISVNPLEQGALSISSLQIVSDQDSEIMSNPSVSCEIPYSQFNYQITFDFLSQIVQSSDLMSSWDGSSMDSKDIENIFDEWKSEYISTIDETVNGYPVYIKDGNKFIMGKRDGIFDKIIPILGSYSFKSNPSDGFKVKIINEDVNLKDFMLGILLEKCHFKASNIQSEEQFVSSGGEMYIQSEEHVIYTGKAKMVILLKTESSIEDRENYFIIKEFSELIDITENKEISAIINYRKISPKEVSLILNKKSYLEYSGRFMGMFTLLVDSSVKFSHSFISDLDCNYNYFDIGFGCPDGGSYSSDAMMPYKMTIYDGVNISLSYSNITITSPYYDFNEDIITVPNSIIDMTNFRVLDSNPSVSDDYSIEEIGLDQEDNFLEIPLSFEGINKSPSIDVGDCGDIHISWEGNKNKYWNIYYNSSISKLKPFREDIKITDTKSNSVVPSVSVNRNGTRMIVWQDDRDGKFEIYGGRSTEGYSCNETLCKNKQYELYKEEIVDCFVSLNFVPPVDGYYIFSINFYNDTALSDLFKTISSQDNMKGWYVNGDSLSSIVEYDDSGELIGVMSTTQDNLVISYIPSKDDGIFDRVLYATVIGTNIV